VTGRYYSISHDLETRDFKLGTQIDRGEYSSHASWIIFRTVIQKLGEPFNWQRVARSLGDS